MGQKVSLPPIAVQAGRTILRLEVNCGGSVKSSSLAVAVSFLPNGKTESLHGIICCYDDVIVSSPDHEYSLLYRPVNDDASIKAPINLPVKPASTYTCPLLRFIFIQFKDDTVESLKQSGCYFYNLNNETESVNAEDEIHLIESPPPMTPSKTLRYLKGSVKEHYGQDIWYNMTSPLTPGLPLLNSSGKLVGIHKCDGTVTVEENKQAQCTLAVPLTTVTAILTASCDQQSLWIKSNPVDMTSYGATLEENGLEVMSLSPSCERYRGCTLYISPASPKEYITAIWFMPTRMGWYWSPTDPEGDLYPNWMPVNRLEVIGGYWHGQIPAPKNVTIIRWLDQHNIN